MDTWESRRLVYQLVSHFSPFWQFHGVQPRVEEGQPPTTSCVFCCDGGWKGSWRLREVRGHAWNAERISKLKWELIDIYQNKNLLKCIYRCNNSASSAYKYIIEIWVIISTCPSDDVACKTEFSLSIEVSKSVNGVARGAEAASARWAEHHKID